MIDPIFREDAYPSSDDDDRDDVGDKEADEEEGPGGEEEEAIQEEEEGSNKVNDPFSDLTYDDYGEFGRYITHTVGPFTCIGDIAEVGASWEDECLKWQAEEQVRRAEGLPESDNDEIDPKDLS